jgi:hypothetical protein
MAADLRLFVEALRKDLIGPDDFSAARACSTAGGRPRP